MPATGFAPIDLDAPLDTRERLAAVPRGLTAKGMIFNANAGRLGLDEPTRGAFRDYPLEELIALQARADERGEGARRLYEAGIVAAANICESMPGRVMLALIGGDLQAGARYAQRVWRIAVTTGQVSHTTLGPRAIQFEVREVWGFHSYLVGTFAGMTRTLEPRAQVTYRRVSLSGFDVLVEW